MKKLISSFVLVLFLTVSTAWAGTNVSFMWDENLEADLAGYRVYRSDTSGGYDKSTDMIWEGTAITATENNVPDGTWYWVATAYDTSGNESGYSNEVTATLDTEPPVPPQNLSIWQKIIAWLQHFFSRWV